MGAYTDAKLMIFSDIGKFLCNIFSDDYALSKMRDMLI